eukprot:GHVN01096581.1.p1 GENE.GHVN01096581.1~~GHVN01096581.1.p1  ORF type:complete len:471 (-),score=19.39 GHVN01096581.1:106-1518(-)
MNDFLTAIPKARNNMTLLPLGAHQKFCTLQVCLEESDKHYTGGKYKGIRRSDGFNVTQKADSNDHHFPGIPEVLSTTDAAITLIQSMFGTGLLVMPYYFMLSGSIAGVLLMMALCFVSYLSALTLCSLAHQTKAATIDQLGEEILGNTWFTRFIVKPSIPIHALGALASNVLVASLLMEISCRMFRIPTMDRSLIQTLVTLSIAVLSISRNYGSFKVLTSVSFIGIMAVLGIIQLESYRLLNEFDRQPWSISSRVNGVQSLLLSLPLIVMAFTCHLNVPQVYAEVRRHKKAGIYKILGIAFSCAGLIYLITGLVPFYVLGAHKVDDDILWQYASFHGHETPLSLKLAVACFGAVTIMKSPLIVLPLKQTIANTANIDLNKCSPFKNTVATLAVCVCAGILAATLPHLSLMLQVNGSVFGNVLVFIIPGFLSLKVRGADKTTIIRGVVLLVVGGFGFAGCLVALLLERAKE